ncbi:MAG: hypothetical protein SPG09_04265 [Lachnospiraceae bacterium]|nr:hypothetical protein [bacterium]MDY5516810.1 hypothetical protein [Lachnospiraceae bacterium]
MDFHSDDNFNGQYRPQARPQDVMLTASVVLSVIAIATTCCVYSSIICGSLGIILALLSRGQKKQLSSQGRLSVMMGTAAILISVLATVMMFVVTIREYGSLENFLKAYSDIMESMTGMPLFEEGII